ncbi:MAG: Asp-tRNA(Asn)/Glu-tRNA(Gln) amidotransferase subunit GatC [Peptococcia bacterium]
MKLTTGDLEKLATLSRLELSAEEKEKYSADLNDVLTHIEAWNNLDTSSVEPTTHVLSLNNVFREDELGPSLDREAVFSNAPAEEDGYFKVPRIL